MRPLETLFIALLVASLLGRLLSSRSGAGTPLWVGLLLAAAAAAFAQGVLEGVRVQLYPAYAALAFAALAMPKCAEYKGSATWAARITLVLALLLGVAGAGLAWVMPVPQLPQPAGPYAVGTHLFHVTDPHREDPYVAGAAREFMLQAWYPAAPAPDARKAPWLPDAEAYVNALADRLGGLPPQLLSHLPQIRANAFDSAPMIGGEDPLPVLIYSHGWTGFRQVAADQCERLASAGYIVLAPDHTHGALATRLPGDRVLLSLPEAMPPREPADARQVGIEKLVDMFAGDLRRVIDLLPTLHAGGPASPLAGRIDTERIGLWGHSTGGGAVVEARADDARVKAAAALDPWVEPVSPANRSTESDVPFLSLRCEEWMVGRDANNGILAEVLASMRGPVYDLWLADSRHADFTLLPLLSPLVGQLGMTGPIPAHRGLGATRNLLAAFFDHHLREQPRLPWQLLEHYPELRAAQ